jgi:hypothetical protein
MKRQMIYLAALAVAFTLGVSIFQVRNKIGRLGKGNDAPLLVMVYHSSSAGAAYRTIKIKNLSDNVVRGYSLGHTCNCRSWDSNNVPYPYGISFTNPTPEQQRLLPGESQELNWEVSTTNDGSAEKLQVWVDLVHFEGGSNWGPNQGRKEGYVRE